MSGGVDSSAAAALLKENGYDIEGVTLVLRENASCLTDTDIRDAASVCGRLGAKHTVLDFSEGFGEKVIGKFISEYENGNTPNPCIECNRFMKFGGLFSYLPSSGCGKIATGHYARVLYDGEKYCLGKAKNRAKDQTYFLYFLTQEQLSRILFPLGDFGSKDEIRAVAEKYGFVNARKKDSQDICFVSGDYYDFIKEKTGKEYPRGFFTDENGNVLGEHKGIICYTIGQRKGLGLALPAPMYVKEKDMANNRVILSPESCLFSSSAIAGGFNWISGVPENSGVTAKTRYSQKETPCSFEIMEDGNVRVEFETPVRAVTKGQALVLYKDDICLGGGTII